MEKRINEQLAEAKKLELTRQPGETVMIDASTYTNHVKYLQGEVEKHKRLSDHWELEYYRLLNKREGKDK